MSRRIEEMKIMERADQISQAGRESLADHIETELASDSLLSQLDEVYLHGFAAGLRAKHWEAFHGGNLPIELPNGSTIRMSISPAPVDTSILDHIKEELGRQPRSDDFGSISGEDK